MGVPDGNLKIATVTPLIISLCSLSQKIGPIALAVQAVGAVGASDLGVSTSYISSPSVVDLCVSEGIFCIRLCFKKLAQNQIPFNPFNARPPTHLARRRAKVVHLARSADAIV